MDNEMNLNPIEKIQQAAAPLRVVRDETAGPADPKKEAESLLESLLSDPLTTAVILSRREAAQGAAEQLIAHMEAETVPAGIDVAFDTAALPAPIRTVGDLMDQHRDRLHLLQRTDAVARALLRNPRYQRAALAVGQDSQLMRMLAETYAVQTREHPEVGDLVFAAIAQTYDPSHLIPAEVYWTEALERLAKAGDSLRARMALAHEDAEFVALGVKFPGRHRDGSIWDRVEDVREGDEKNPLIPEDWTFDAQAACYYGRDRRGRRTGPFSRDSMRTRFINHGGKTNDFDSFIQGVNLTDESRAIYDQPGEIVRVSGVSVLNTYQPAALVPMAGPWPNLYAACLNLVNGNHEHLDYVLDWLAAPLQSLHRTGRPLKMKSALVFHGEPGAGKGTLANALTDCYGAANVVTFGQDLLESKNNGFLSGKLLAVGNEISSPATRTEDLMNKLKDWITEPTIPIEDKWVKAHPEVNAFNMLFMSNQDKPVLVAGKDRRFSVFKTGPNLPKEGAAFDADWNGPKRESAAFFAHLLSRDVKVEQAQLCDTEARRELQALSANSAEKFAAAIEADGWRTIAGGWAESRGLHDSRTDIESLNGKDVVTFNRAQDVYRHWCQQEGLYALGSKKLAAALRVRFPGLTDGNSRAVGGRYWSGLPMEAPDAD